MFRLMDVHTLFLISAESRERRPSAKSEDSDYVADQDDDINEPSFEDSRRNNPHSDVVLYPSFNDQETTV